MSMLLPNAVRTLRQRRDHGRASQLSLRRPLVSRRVPDPLMPRIPFTGRTTTGFRLVNVVARPL